MEVNQRCAAAISKEKLHVHVQLPHLKVDIMKWV